MAEAWGRRGKGVLLFLKNLLFTVIVPGAVAVYAPLGLAGGRGALPPKWGGAQYASLLPLATGCAVYFWCPRWSSLPSNRSRAYSHPPSSPNV